MPYVITIKQAPITDNTPHVSTNFMGKESTILQKISKEERKEKKPK